MTPHRDARHVKSKLSVPPRFPVDEDVWTFAGKPMPIIYEDEGQDEMGESNLHTLADRILSVGIQAHLQPRPTLQVFSNLNCYYDPDDRAAYVSPDVMVVEPFERLPEDLTSYRIGTHGPAPLQALEILSQRSFQQRDLTDKPIIYGLLGVAEYMLADLTGRFLAERLQLMRRGRNGAWKMKRDPDGGITSKLRFRILIDADNQFRVLNAETGERYLRPEEAQAAEQERQKETRARQRAEKRIRELEAELKRLRKSSPGS